MGFFVRALPWGSLAIAAGLLAPASAEAEAPLKTGASFSNTGIYAPLGQAVHRGQRLGVKDANEKGGVLGRKIELTGRVGSGPPM